MVINGENESIKEIPYGISDYELIRTENYYYVDKIGEIGKTFNGNFNRLKTLIEKEEISAKVEKGFPLEKLMVGIKDKEWKRKVK